MLEVAKKSERMELLIGNLVPRSSIGLPPAYEGYFLCFNQGEYYEAHDVLEHLWLQTSDSNAPFFKGLIQMAGAFVHLKKQYLRPHHHKDGRRLAPAWRLFGLALENLAPYPSEHWALDLEQVRGLCEGQRQALALSGWTRNPWRPESAPKLQLCSTKIGPE